MKEQVQVQWDQLYLVEFPSVEEKLVLDLACAFEKEADPDYCVVTRESQQKAAEYFNTHGFVKTLDKLMELGGDDAEGD